MTKCRTDGTSAFNKRTARLRLPRLDPARREGEVEEDSVQQQHNGVVVVEERGNPAGLRQAPRERRRTWERGRAAPTLWFGCPPTPFIYIGARERGAGPLRSHLRRGRRPRGGALPPKARGAPPLG